MLTKYLVSPLKLARLMEWNGRFGKSCPIMAIDITNHHIGIAFAYYRQQTTPPLVTHQSTHENNDANNTHDTSIATSITPLPPIPYMSERPYHPSYAFFHHHRPESCQRTTPRCLDRIERTIEVADQLAQLAITRQVKGIVVRWPGELASAVGGDFITAMEPRRDVEEGQLSFSLSNEWNTERRNGEIGNKFMNNGSMGYMRGRILYLLDKCYTRHGHADTKVHMEPLLVEGSRPFTFFDTSLSERRWIIREHPTTPNNSHCGNNLSTTAQRKETLAVEKNRDMYGNSVPEMDRWGRCSTFGNQPPLPQQGAFFYSSTKTTNNLLGYSVSDHFELNNGSHSGNRENESQKSRSHSKIIFDGLHEHESKAMQFQGSLSAMHTLCDFANQYLQGRIVLPVWASVSYSGCSQTTTEVSYNRSDGGNKSVSNDNMQNVHSDDNDVSRMMKSPDLSVVDQPKRALSLAGQPMIRKATRRKKY